jgi:hypothetical protein
VIEIVSLNQLIHREDGVTRTVNDMVQMSKTPQPGDSGGPVYSGLAAYGISTALGSGGHLIYSKILNAETGTGVTICLTSAC